MSTGRRAECGQGICKESPAFLCHRKVLLWHKKRSAGIALRRKGIMSLKRPAAGGKSRKRDSFYKEKHVNAVISGMQPVGDKLQYADFLQIQAFCGRIIL